MPPRGSASASLPRHAQRIAPSTYSFVREREQPQSLLKLREPKMQTIRKRTRTSARLRTSEVGYGKPPVKNRFQKGISGNEKGRPRGSTRSRAHLKKSLQETIVVTIDGKETRMSREAAVYMGLLRDALKGDNVARRMLLAEMRRVDDAEFSEEPKSNPAPVAGPADEAILARYRREIIEEFQKQQKITDLDEEGAEPLAQDE